MDKTQSLLLKRGPSKSVPPTPTTPVAAESDAKGKPIDLHAEIEANNIGMVLKLITPENVNSRNSRQETLVHKACSIGNLRSSICRISF